MPHCSPKHLTTFKRTGSCFTKEALIRMAKAYNQDHRQEAGFVPIPVRERTKSQLWEALHERFRDVCGPVADEACWADVTRIGAQALRPVKPVQWETNPFTWLSNYDIMYVMKQYEERYTDFEFLGVFPIDFAHETYLGRCVSEQICRLDTRTLRRKGIRHFGAIFNLDRHNEPGSHWVALYVSLDPAKANYGVYFYDSNSTPPPKEIRALTKTIVEQNKQAHQATSKRRFESKVNRIRHQFKNTECGMFSMYFIIRCLEGERFSKIVTDNTRDETVHRLRNVFFRPSSPVLK